METKDILSQLLELDPHTYSVLMHEARRKAKAEGSARAFEWLGASAWSMLQQVKGNVL